MSDAFDPYYKWLSIVPEEQPPNHYRLLGTRSFEPDRDVIANAADQRMAHVRSFQMGKYAALSQRILNEIAAARVCLLNPQKKAAYDARLQAELPPKQPAPAEESGSAVNLGFDVSLRAPVRVEPSSPRRKSASRRILAGIAVGVVALLAIIAVIVSGGKKANIAPDPVAKADVAKKDPPEPQPAAEPTNLEPPKAQTLVAREPVRAPPLALDGAKALPAPRRPEPAVKFNPTAPPLERLEEAARRVQAALAAAKSSQDYATVANAALDLVARAVGSGNQGVAKVASLVALRAARKADDEHMLKLATLCWLEPAANSPVAGDPTAGAKREKAQLLAPPGATAQEETLKLVRETFKAKYDAATTPERAIALAEELFDKAEMSGNDPAAQYVLLQEAGRLAVGALNVELAFQVVDAMAARFAVDGLEIKFRLVGAAARSVKASQAKDLAERIFPLAEGLAAKDQCDAAEQLGTLAVELARKARDIELLKKTVAHNKQLKAELDALRGADAQAKQAEQVLEGNPADPAANLELGRHLCFIEGQWPKGLSMLALGSDVSLKDLAIQELKGVTDATAQAKIGDAWWDRGENEGDACKKRLKTHAGGWYQQAVGGLSGLAKDKTQARLAEIGKTGQAIPKASITPHQRKVTNSVGMEFVLIPAGEFWMGSTPEEIARATADAQQKSDKSALERLAGEAPRHRVRIGRPFLLAVCPVTQAEYQRVMGTNPSQFSAEGKLSAKVAGQDTGRFPVENVSWPEAVDFCRKLSERETASGWKYRLPTEAEWEYACRAGSTTKWPFGDQESTLPNYAWFLGNSGGATHPVGQKRPSPWGLCDMQGNLRQWCADYYDPAYYAASPGDDPQGPASGSFRVVRGSCWNDIAVSCRAANRFFHAAGWRDGTVGFRVCRVPLE
jgi:formylglycine-generating enzyme required for sulfatase activity